MNSVFLSGRVTRDPELRRTGSGNSMCTFTLAVNKGDEKASFVDCICYEKLAENVIKHVVKGDKVTVEGKLNQRTFERQDGSKGSVVEVLVRGAEFQLKLNVLDTDEEPEEPKTTKKSKKH